MKSCIKLLRVPALISLSLLAATSAQSVNQLVSHQAPVRVANSLLGAPSLVVWSSQASPETADRNLSRWAAAMQAQYARTGLRVQALERSSADVRQVVNSHALTASTARGLMVFDHAGRLRLATASPDSEHLSTAEAAAQALIAQRELPPWIDNTATTQRYRHVGGST